MRSWAILALLASSSFAQSLKIENRINGVDLLKSFDPVKERIQQFSAVIYKGREKLVYGTVVSTDGYILTKASELNGPGPFVVRIGKKKFTEVEVLQVRQDWDVALLKVDGEHFPQLPINAKSAIPAGSWLVSNGATTRKERRIRVGVLSANARKIDGVVVALGIVYREEENEGLRISGIAKESGAEEAGLEKEDVIVAIEGQRKDLKDVLESVLQQKFAGDSLSMIYVRDSKEYEITIILKDRIDLFGEQKTRNDSMSGRYSRRRSQFPKIIQHDIPLSRESVGGPVFTLDGGCIGMNIAVANRCESYAIPIENLLKLSQNMISEKEKR